MEAWQSWKMDGWVFLAMEVTASQASEKKISCCYLSSEQIQTWIGFFALLLSYIAADTAI